MGIVIYFYVRESPENNIRRAIKFHKKGISEAERSNFQQADVYYEIARIYREKAMQQKGEM